MDLLLKCLFIKHKTFRRLFCCLNSFIASDPAGILLKSLDNVRDNQDLFVIRGIRGNAGPDKSYDELRAIWTAKRIPSLYSIVL